MKILLYKNEGSHHKNNNALQNYKNIDFFTINSINDVDNLNEYDCLISLCEPINVVNYPNLLFIFGPHFSVFPDDKLNLIKGKNSYYNNLSEWVLNLWSSYEITNGINLITLPFGVETNKFTEIKPIDERNKVFLYYKHRDNNELNFLTQLLNSKNIDYRIFSYGTYNESDYLDYLQQSKYGIILDAHESQGFGIQEALSCNVPLLVWNVSSLNQESTTNYHDYPATTISYWDERCGEFFYKKEEIEEKFELFLSKLETYNPRQYILETLSMEVCERRLIDFINEKKSIIETTP